MTGIELSTNTKENGAVISIQRLLAAGIPMTILQKFPFWTEVLEGRTLSVGEKEYFRARFQSRLHQLVMAEFLRHEDQGLTQAELARRTGKRAEVINRLFGSPGNWTLNTVSDLLLGMGGEPEIDVSYFGQPIAQLSNSPTFGQPQDDQDNDLQRLIEQQMSPPSSSTLSDSDSRQAKALGLL